MTFSTSAGLSSNLAYITSVFIGHIGTDSSIGSPIKTLQAAKSRREDGRNLFNNQRKASDMLAWSEGTDNGRQENQKSWLWRHCRRRAIYWLPDHPRKLVTLNPKLKSTGAGRHTSFFPAGGCSTARSAWPERLPLRKVRTLWHCSRLRSVALYLRIDRGDIRQAIDRCSNICLTAGRWLWSVRA